MLHKRLNARVDIYLYVLRLLYYVFRAVAVGSMYNHNIAVDDYRFESHMRST